MMITKMPTTSEITDAEFSVLKDTGRFLADYAALLLKSGATCVRLEKSVNRMAYAWHTDVAITITPHHIHLTIADAEFGDSFTIIKGIDKTAISYDIITRLSRLSWAVADNGLSVENARSAMVEIMHTPVADRRWVLFAVSCANASFCRLFGGDIVAMATVFAATMAGYYLKQVLSGCKIDVRIVFVLCAFVSSVLGATDWLFHIGSTPDVALATSVLYLVPGIPFLNSFSDMIDGHYVCFFSRLTDAVILTGCLSVGLRAGMMLMHAGMF